MENAVDAAPYLDVLRQTKCNSEMMKVRSFIRRRMPHAHTDRAPYWAIWEADYPLSGRPVGM